MAIQIEYKKTADVDWIVATSDAAASEILSGLEPGEEYQVRKLDTVTGLYSDVVTEIPDGAGGVNYVNQLNTANPITDTNIYYGREIGTNTWEFCVNLGNNKGAMYEMIREDGGVFRKLSTFSIVELIKVVNATQSGTGFSIGVTNRYTTNIGDTISTTFTGTGVVFSFFSDNRGGVWRFTIDGGNPVDVSTYRASGTSTTTATVYPKGSLSYGEHTLVGTFMGDDPSNVPSGGAGTSRGWFTRDDESNVSDTSHTFRLFGGDINYRFKSGFEVCPYSSNREFALNTLPQGATIRDWFPSHGAVTTSYNTIETDYVIMADGVRIYEPASGANSSHRYYRNPVSNVTITQTIYGRFSENPGVDVLKAEVIHTFTKDGVTVDTNFEVLQPCNITGYGIMIPTSRQFVDKIIDDTGAEYAADLENGTNINIPTMPNTYSFLGVHENSASIAKLATALAVTIISPYLSYRKNEGKSATGFVQNRDTSLSKTYFEIYDTEDLPIGHTARFQAHFVVQNYTP